MIARTDELTPRQRALQTLALKQLTAAAETMRRLKAIPASQADREALNDSIESLQRSEDCLRLWFGGSPATPFDD